MQDNEAPLISASIDTVSRESTLYFSSSAEIISLNFSPYYHVTMRVFLSDDYPERVLKLLLAFIVYTVYQTESLLGYLKRKYEW